MFPSEEHSLEEYDSMKTSSNHIHQVWWYVMFVVNVFVVCHCRGLGQRSDPLL